VNHEDGFPNTRREFMRHTTKAAALLSPALQAAPADGPRPNIVYLHSHDSGRYLQPYGHAVPTPNIQRLASEGVLFRRAFSAAPTCSPSRSVLLTGQFAHQNGMLGLAHRGFAMNDYKKHIVETLRGAGYHSVLAGLQHVAPKPETIGYDEILHPQTMSAVNVAPGAAEYLDRKPEQPFFLDVGFFETHREYPKPTRDRQDRCCPADRATPRFRMPSAPPRLWPAPSSHSAPSKVWSPAA